MRFYIQPKTAFNPDILATRKLEANQPNLELCDSKTKTQHVTRKQKVDQLSEVDYVTTNTHSSRGESQLYIFEDHEAVIKMIIKGRSPTMRHVTRTHRVALDWLFDRINLEPKIQIKYVDTKNQLADMLNKENFSRDEWNHLLCLFIIMSFSTFWQPFQKFSLSSQRAPCDWCHVETRTRHNLE